MKNKKTFKILSVILCAVMFMSLLSACSSTSNELTEENVQLTVDTAFNALKEFDTETLQEYVDSDTLTTIIGYAEKHEQIAQLGAAIFENLTVEVKEIDLENQTVTVTVSNKDLYEAASDFASELKSEYTTLQLLAKLSDENFLNRRLTQLQTKIDESSMGEGVDITLNIEQTSDNLKLSFDETAEDAVSGGALSAIKQIFS